MTTCTLAGGCFWCLDAVFRRLDGVEASVCGYVGGDRASANYMTVSTGTTDHAEVVQVTFDESLLPPDVLLDIFFSIHNPTTKDRQGADVGRQYRSALLYEDQSQRQVFERAIERHALNWDDPIVTELQALEAFYEAEPEHQDYFSNNPSNGYCSIVIEPKIAAVRRSYASWLRNP